MAYTSKKLTPMKKALIFSVAVCGISWIAALTFHLTTGYTGPESGLESAAAYQKFAMLYMFLPMIVALILQAIDGKLTIHRPHKSRIQLKVKDNTMTQFHLRWSWLVAILIVPVVVALSILFSALFAEVVSPIDGTLALMQANGISELPAEMGRINDGIYILTTLISGLIAGSTINAIFAFGEEYGWRLYMVEALRGKSFLSSALFIGTIWGIWHAPLILMGHNGYPNRWLGIVMMVLFCILSGIVELYFVRKSGTVWPAALFHGTINALAGLSVLMIPSGNTLLTGVTGVAGLMALSVVIAALYLYDRYISRERIFSDLL